MKFEPIQSSILLRYSPHILALNYSNLNQNYLHKLNKRKIYNNLFEQRLVITTKLDDIEGEERLRYQVKC